MQSKAIFVRYSFGHSEGQPAPPMEAAGQWTLVLKVNAGPPMHCLFAVNPPGWRPRCNPPKNGPCMHAHPFSDMIEKYYRHEDAKCEAAFLMVEAHECVYRW